VVLVKNLEPGTDLAFTRILTGACASVHESASASLEERRMTSGEGKRRSARFMGRSRNFEYSDYGGHGGLGAKSSEICAPELERAKIQRAKSPPQRPRILDCRHKICQSKSHS